MVIKFSRAQRRHDRARMYKKARMIQLSIWTMDQSEEYLQWAACRIRDNLKICSCQMCCNPRRSKWLPNDEQKTIQERRADELFDDII